MSFTVLDRSETWLGILVAFVALGVSPILAGWLAPRFFGAAFIGVMSFPLSTFLSLSVAFRVFGADTYDVEPFPFTIVLSAIYGGLHPWHSLRDGRREWFAVGGEDDKVGGGCEGAGSEAVRGHGIGLSLLQSRGADGQPIARTGNCTNRQRSP